MANALYGKGRNKFARGDILWKATSGDTIRAMLVDAAAYTLQIDVDEFFSDVPVGARKGNNGGTNRSDMPQLTLLDPALGVCDANNITFTTVPAGNALEYLVLFKDTGVDGTSPLIALLDGKAQVEIAKDAAQNDTTIFTEDLPGTIASGATMTKISGTGPATIITTAEASEGARQVSVQALSAAITAGAVYEYPVKNSGLPITPNGADINVSWGDGANKIFKL